MTKKRMLNLLLVSFFAFTGGVVSQLLLHAGVSRAAGQEDRRVFSGQDGRPRLDIGVYKDQPLANFYGQDGNLRIQIGTYSGDVVSTEKGLPVMTFSDNQGHLKMLFRLAGSNQSPVLIMKDSQKRDRLVLGLSLAGTGEEPFLATFDRNGTKHMIFGDY